MGRAIAFLAVAGAIFLVGLFLITGGTFVINSLLQTIALAVVAVVAIVFGSGVNNMIFGGGNSIDQSVHKHYHYGQGSGHVSADRQSAKFLDED